MMDYFMELENYLNKINIAILVNLDMANLMELVNYYHKILIILDNYNLINIKALEFFKKIIILKIKYIKECLKKILKMELEYKYGLQEIFILEIIIVIIDKALGKLSGFLGINILVIGKLENLQ